MPAERMGAFLGGVAVTAVAGLIAFHFWTPPADQVAKPVAPATTAADLAMTKPAEAHLSSAFKDTPINEILPTGDGAVYMSDLGWNVWYVRGAEAVRVHEVPAFTGAGVQPTTVPSLIPVLQDALRKDHRKLADIADELEQERADK